MKIVRSSPGFNQQHLCAHCIAAAEDNNLLKQYLESYAEFVKTPAGCKRIIPNFTCVSMNDLPHGRKGNNKAPKRKAVKRRKVEEN